MGMLQRSGGCIRDGIPIREIARQTGLSRNTIRTWLRQPEMTQPQYPPAKGQSVLDPWADQLRQWLQTDSHRSKRERRTGRVMFEALREQTTLAATPASPPSSANGRKSAAKLPSAAPTSTHLRPRRSLPVRLELRSPPSRGPSPTSRSRPHQALRQPRLLGRGLSARAMKCSSTPMPGPSPPSADSQRGITTT